MIEFIPLHLIIIDEARIPSAHNKKKSVGGAFCHPLVLWAPLQSHSKLGYVCSVHINKLLRIHKNHSCEAAAADDGKGAIDPINKTPKSHSPVLCLRRTFIIIHGEQAPLLNDP